MCTVLISQHSWRFLNKPPVSLFTGSKDMVGRKVCSWWRRSRVGSPNRTVPNIGRTEQRSCSFPGEHEPRRTVAPYVRFVWMFGSPGYEPSRTDVSNVRVRFVFGSFGSV